MDKIKLTGIKNIVLAEEIEFDENSEFLVALIASLDGVFNSVKRGDEEPSKTYHLKVIRPEMIKRIGEKENIKIKSGYSKSQKLRFSIISMFKRAGIDNTEENYEEHMDKIIQWVNSKSL